MLTSNTQANPAKTNPTQAKTISLCNQKGGVGKTATAVNLGSALARMGKRVLLIDFDPQGNLSMCLGISQPDDLPNSIAILMQQAIELKPLNLVDCILRIEGMDIIPGNIQLAGIETTLVNALAREYVLKRIVDELRGQYDYILIDCGPSLGMLTVNALAASDSVIIPMQAQYLSLKGLEMLLVTISRIRVQINKGLDIEGILVTMLDKHYNLCKDAIAALKGNYGDSIRVFESMIPRSIKAAECTVAGTSIFEYSNNTAVAHAYRDVAEEVLGYVR